MIYTTNRGGLIDVPNGDYPSGLSTRKVKIIRFDHVTEGVCIEADFVFVHDHQYPTLVAVCTNDCCVDSAGRGWEKDIPVQLNVVESIGGLHD